MAEQAARRRNQRLGFTRYFVPHPAYRWFNERLALAAVLSSAFFGLAALWYQRSVFNALGLAEVVSAPELRGAMEIYTHTTLAATGLSIVTSAVFVIMIATYLSHKIAGPVYRLQQHMQGVIDGRTPSELTFRKDDQLADVSATFNALMRHLGQLEAAAPKPTPAESQPETNPARSEPLALGEPAL